MMARIEFPKILGLNQLVDETALVAGDGETMFVRQVLNTDIDTAGNISRRNGAVLRLAGAGYHSLYKANARNWLLLCYKNELGVFQPSTYSFVPLVTMDDAYLTSFTENNGFLYAMNPSFSCLFRPGSTTAEPLGVPLPDIDPQFDVLASGGMDAGIYGVAYTIIDPNGEESGLSKVQTLTLAENQGIAGTLFSVLSGYKYRIYMTAANGDTLRQAIEFDANVAAINIEVVEEGRLAETHGLEPAPLGHVIRAFGSRLLVGTVDYVYFTEAFRPHLWDPRNFVHTTGFTTMIEPVEEGVFIGDRNGVVFYLGDDPTSWRIKNTSPEQAIFGTSLRVPGSFFSGELASFSEVAVWLTNSGYQIGTPTGEVIRLNAGQVKLPSYAQGCTSVVIKDGRKQIVTPVNSNQLASASVALDSTTIY